MPIFDPTKDELIKLRAVMSNTQIAEMHGVSPSSVKRRITSLDVPKRPSKVVRLKSNREPPRYVSVDEGVSLMDKCKQILGDRMGEDRARGYLLDERPASSQQVIKAAGLTLSVWSKPV